MRSLSGAIAGGTIKPFDQLSAARRRHYDSDAALFRPVFQGK
jgi:hypothetical protein